MSHGAVLGDANSGADPVPVTGEIKAAVGNTEASAGPACGCPVLTSDNVGWLPRTKFSN